ncbi:MAG: TolC family protein [Phycisphaerales bacterium]|nr:TolC family protein [Phycisphaerales bacterium]
MVRSYRFRFKGRLRRPLAGLSLAGIVALAAGGCQSYEHRPLDMAGHQTAFLARTPENPEVQSFAASLAASAPQSGEFNPADGITCEEAELIALVFNADLRVARLRAGVTQATAENAGLWEDPTIGVDLTRIVESTPEPWKVFTSVGITIPISGRLDIEKQRAGIEHAAELARVAQREWSVRMSVRRAWGEWSALDAQLTVTRDFLGRVDQILTVVDKMEQAGEIARTEARLFRIEKATKAADLAVLESRALEADLRLRQLMGMSPDAPLRFQASGVGPARTSGLEGPDALDLERRSPAMLVAAAEYEAAEKALELEVRKQYPDLHIGPGYGNEDGLDQVLLGLSIPIPILNANRQRIAEARAQRDLSRAGAEATLEQAIASLRAAEVRHAAAKRRRQSLETDIVPLVDAQYADARQVARLGEVNTLVLLESLTRQQEAKVGLVEAARDEAIAAVDLDELFGPEPSAMPPNPASTPGPVRDPADPSGTRPTNSTPQSIAPSSGPGR